MAELSYQDVVLQLLLYLQVVVQNNLQRKSFAFYSGLQKEMAEKGTID